jgi:hypothetical protein
MMARAKHALVRTVCFPYKVCCRAVNFCSPEGAVGPPDIPGPGRFHPVPTHPVFEASPEPLDYPAEN